MTSRIGITGAGGLLGWHLRCWLRAHATSAAPAASAPLTAGRETFEDEAALRRFVSGCDVIVHYAGVNRGEAHEVEAANPEIARRLVDACEREDRMPHVIFASSVHAANDSPYGRSKRAATEILGAWAARTGAGFTNLLLPHVYGECGRPFHNSVVSTFCHQLAHGDEPRIDVDAPLELLHAQDLSDLVGEIAAEGRTGELRPRGVPVRSVSALLDRLRTMMDAYRADLLPDLSDPFDVRLFNTLRSYLYPEGFPVALPLHSDERGALFEAVKAGSGGQTFVSSTNPGVTRGNHFHRFKVERFLVLRGSARIRVRRLFSERVWSFDVNGDRPAYVDMPTLHTHDITNTGADELVTLFWANEIFDSERPDTYREDV